MSMNRLPLIVLLAGCAAAPPPRPTTPEPLEEVRIEGRVTAGGEVTSTAYDAETLFDRGVALSQEEHCDEAVEAYDQLLSRFPTSRYASPALYNSALCLKQSTPEAAALRFERLIEVHGGTRNALHARFQLTELYLELERWNDGIETADHLLSRDDITSEERAEAMARKAQHLLGAERIEDAAGQANATLSYARTRRGDEIIDENYFVAAANFVYAETLRLQAAAIELPEGNIAQQRPVLERRAEILLAAQRAYFDTMRHTHPYWASAAGYRIGAMYDAFWQAIMTAPVPPYERSLDAQQQAAYEEVYRYALARLVKPLIRHSIRYWELTLLMIERTGAESTWSERIREDLERARERLIEQPEGPEGIDAAGRIAEDIRQRLETRLGEGAPSENEDRNTPENAPSPNPGSN